MATKKKLLQAAAGNAGGGALNVEDVFSTYLYTGNGTSASSSLTVTNNIDLDGEGGLLWIKGRSATHNHQLFTPDIGLSGSGSRLSSNLTSAGENDSGYLSSFNSNGFTVGDGYLKNESYDINVSGRTYVSWTFRKAPKFFDVVTYTGTGSSQSISHNLDCQPGMIIAKRTDSSTQGDWIVSVLDTSVSSTYYRRFYLNKTDASITNDSATATTTTFDPNKLIGADGSYTANASGGTYVAYLFAHNDGDGEFGPDGDADIIKCGSYTGTGADGNFVDLGFEPQWVMIKRADGTGDWNLFDNMRGMAQTWYAQLKANTADAESAGATKVIPVFPTGFELNLGASNWNASGSNYIYIAIRRGTKVPESGTEVFATEPMTSGGPPDFVSGFPVDFALHRFVTGIGNWDTTSRLQGNASMKTNDNTAESTQTYVKYDYQDGFFGYGGAFANYQAWMWKRAPKYFDVVAYTGTGASLSHNLAVTPELIIVKNRGIGSWRVTTSAANGVLYIDASDGSNGTSPFQTLTPCNATTMNLNSVSQAGDNIAYLFASLDGVSKVGSYTGNGSSQTIDCGFTSGARFILVKRADSTGDWYVWDTERGIVAANDPHLSLNTTAAEVTTDDSIDPVSSGFAVNQVSATNINVSSASYIFYAIA